MGKHNPDTSRWKDYTDAQLDAEMDKLEHMWGVKGRTLAHVADQIKIYKEANAAKAKAAIEKSRVQEKQIRSLRNSFRPAGAAFMGRQSSPQLGDNPALPSKLGTA